ncbi:hypothetical protein E3J51_05220 [Candidatus Bathyarchaeota archaeon]|nr:MAG: hypothetical protein E3J51_05220 [Candidatus Bathyarchaeota archaeon]
MTRTIPTGCRSLDERLKDGLHEGRIVLVYGEAETGKTTLAIQCAVNCARMGYKTIFIDCDHTFFARRMAQIASKDFEELAPQIILMKPQDFRQQAFVIDRLAEYVGERVGLIVIDTVTGFYSEGLDGNMREMSRLNRELNRQMAYLAQITRTKKVASLIVSQVRSVFRKADRTVQPVAMRVLKFWADASVSIWPTAEYNKIRVNVETPSKKRGKPIFLRIEKGGLRDYRG